MDGFLPDDVRYGVDLRSGVPFERRYPPGSRYGRFEYVQWLRDRARVQAENPIKVYMEDGTWLNQMPAGVKSFDWDDYERRGPRLGWKAGSATPAQRYHEATSYSGAKPGYTYEGTPIVPSPLARIVQRALRSPVQYVFRRTPDIPGDWPLPAVGYRATETQPLPEGPVVTFPSRVASVLRAVGLPSVAGMVGAISGDLGARGLYGSDAVNAAYEAEAKGIGAAHQMYRDYVPGYGYAADLLAADERKHADERAALWQYFQNLVPMSEHREMGAIHG